MSELTYDQIMGCLITYNREQAGMSIRELAKVLDLKYQHIWDLENGLRPVTRFRIRKIIAALNTTPETYWMNYPKAVKMLRRRMAEKPVLN